MNSSTHIVFLAREDDALVSLATDLSRLGFAVHVHRDPGTLHSAFILDACPLILVALPPAELNDTVMRVRALHPTAGLLVFASFEDSEQRVRTMLCGADYCVDAGVSAVEIATMMRAMSRRGAEILASVVPRDMLPDGEARQAAGSVRGHPTVAPGGVSLWRLANKGWTLIAPSGRALALTAGERELVNRFFMSPDRKIRREVDLRCTDASEGLVARDENVSPRVIDVMISRLRRKASQKQMGLPIRAVPGWGYVFAGEIETIDDASGYPSSQLTADASVGHAASEHNDDCCCLDDACN